MHSGSSSEVLSGYPLQTPHGEVGTYGNLQECSYDSRIGKERQEDETYTPLLKAFGDASSADFSIAVTCLPHLLNPCLTLY